MLKKILTILYTGLFVGFVFADPPVIDPIGDISFDEGSTTTFNVTAIDPDDDDLSFLCINVDENPVTNCIANDNQITLSVTDDDWYGGPEIWRIVVSDGSEMAAQDFNVIVLPVNDAPVSFDIVVSTPEETTINISLDATDIDDDDLFFSIINNLLLLSISKLKCISSL